MPAYFQIEMMDADEDYGSYYQRNSPRQNGSVHSDIGDMSFMMIDYIKEAMKVKIPLSLLLPINHWIVRDSKYLWVR